MKKKKRAKVLRPILPNAGNRAWYRKKILTLNEEMQRSVSWWLMSELRKNGSAADLNRTMEELTRRWQDRYEEEAASIAEAFVKRVNTSTVKSMEQAFVSVGFDIKLRNTREVNNILNSLRYTQVDLIRSIPARALEAVSGIVQRGVQAGRDIAYIQDELKKRFAVTNNRARTIAIDQSNKATQAIREAHDLAAGITEGIWDHVPGRKTSRPTHVAMNGKRFKLYGPDRGLYDSAVGRNVMPGELILCFPGFSNIDGFVGVNKLFRRFYSGKASQIVMDNGVRFYVTPNHPVLSSNGWKAAKFVNSGDYLFQRPRECGHIGELNGDNGITSFQNFFESVKFFGVSSTVLGGAHSHFHGDVSDSEIDVIDINGFLSNVSYSSIFEKGRKFGFSRSDVGQICRFLSQPSSLAEFFGRSFAASARDVSGFGLKLALFYSSLGVGEKLALSQPSGFDSGDQQSSSDCISGNIEPNSNALFRISCLIERDNLFRRESFSICGECPRMMKKTFISKMPTEFCVGNAEDLGGFFDGGSGIYKPQRVIKNSLVDFSGHVYNLETKNNMYGTETIIAHNCACGYRAVLPEFFR